MGRVYSAAIRGIAAAAAAPYATFTCGANARARVREIGFFASAATAASVGLGRSANNPAATGPVAGQPHDPLDLIAALGALHATWTTAPTVPAVFMKRAVLPAVIGAGLIWTFQPDQLLFVAGGASAAVPHLTFWNFGAAAGPAPDIHVTWEE